jgi:hypothetical protein
MDSAPVNHGTEPDVKTQETSVTTEGDQERRPSCAAFVARRTVPVHYTFREETKQRKKEKKKKRKKKKERNRAATSLYSISTKYW